MIGATAGRAWRRRRSGAAAGALIALAGLAAAQTSPAPAPTATWGAGQGLSSTDADSLRAALAAARSGSGDRIRSAMAAITDPTARRIALWALVDTAPASLGFIEADGARRDLAGWPHAERREMAAEARLDAGGLEPEATLTWFAGGLPKTLQGALALATALNVTGRVSDATALIRDAWRTLPGDIDTQDKVLARFGTVFTTADQAAREDRLLYGEQGQTAEDMLRLLPPDQRALARARMAVRRGDTSAQSLMDALPPGLSDAPGLIYERILVLRDRGDTAGALALMSRLPQDLPPEAAQRLWKHGALAFQAMLAGDAGAAYAAAGHSGLRSGADAADAEFRAGWIALVKLKTPQAADAHFARVQTAGASPLTQSRALYWRGRSAEAMGDAVAARIFYTQAARYVATFYGQLAGGRIGAATLDLGRDPEISAADRARFEGRESLKAARILAQIGARDTLKTFVTAAAETLPTGGEEALLVDFTRDWGDPELAMFVVRAAARRDFILPERGYPLRAAPAGPGAPEAAFILGVVRQESSFDPKARSGAGARGMMQVMPATAQAMARALGVGAGDLDDPDFNMTVGSAYLGQLVGQFGGSYVMAAAAYNAGPGRPSQWAAACGDPRSSATDPVDFIECIPFSQTRDYVMRVLEATEVYRARLNGGTGPNSLAGDLRRGGYGYAAMGAMAGGR